MLNNNKTRWKKNCVQVNLPESSSWICVTAPGSSSRYRESVGAEAAVGRKHFVLDSGMYRSDPRVFLCLIREHRISFPRSRRSCGLGKKMEYILFLTLLLSWQSSKNFSLSKRSAATQVSEGEIHVEYWAGLSFGQSVSI